MSTSTLTRLIWWTDKQATEQLDSEKIRFEIFDSNYKARKDYLGIYECDFLFVYGKDKHRVSNFWIALCNPEAEDFSKVNGYLKISISVLHADDPRVELRPEPAGENAMMVLPPQVSLQYYEVALNIFKAEDFPKMDTGFFKKNKTACNAYLKLKYMGITLKTSVKNMKDGLIVWNECLKVHV